MKVVMIFPDPSSEKGISKYSLDLVKNIRKQGLNISEATFINGKFSTLLKKLSRLKRYDIIHLQHEYNLLGNYGLPYFVILPFFGIFKKKSLVVTMHTVPSLKSEFSGSKIKTILRKVLYKIQNKVIEWTADRVIVHARSFKNILINEYGFDESQIVVLPHSIIEDIKTKSKAAARKELKLSGKVYLLIGTMMPDHGHDVIVRKADKIGKTILIATNPTPVNYRNAEKIKNYLALNQKIVKENNFQKFVRFDLGVLPYEKWWKYFSAADLVLLPYRGGVGSGIFADAMAMNKPVIGSGRYFIEFAEDYGAIKLVNDDKDFPKAIHEAMKPKNYKKMLDECKRFMKENGLTPISKKYKALYNSL